MTDARTSRRAAGFARTGCASSGELDAMHSRIEKFESLDTVCPRMLVVVSCSQMLIMRQRDIKWTVRTQSIHVLVTSFAATNSTSKWPFYLILLNVIESIEGGVSRDETTLAMLEMIFQPVGLLVGFVTIGSGTLERLVERGGCRIRWWWTGMDNGSSG